MALSRRRHGARVLPAETTQMALLLFEQHQPDVVIADLELPELDGWAFIQAVRDLSSERQKRTPAIAVTAHNTPADRLKSLSAGFTLHVAKPLSPDQLAIRVALLVKPVPPGVVGP